MRQAEIHELMGRDRDRAIEQSGRMLLKHSKREREAGRLCERHG